MQRNDLYIGYPSQQGKVIRELRPAVNRGRSGVFFVTSGVRAGKTTIVKNLESQFGLRYSLPGFDNDYAQTFKEYESVITYGGVDPTNILISTSEIPIEHSQNLRALSDIVRSEISKGNKIRVIGEVVTKRFPVWNSNANNKYIASSLRNIFEPKLLQLFPLDTDLKRLAEGIWMMRETEHASTWGQTAEELGFPPSYSEFWRSIPNSKDYFVEGLVKIMKKNPNGNLEGQRRGGERF